MTQDACVVPRLQNIFGEGRRFGRVFCEDETVFDYASMLLPRFLSDLSPEIAGRYHRLLFNPSTSRLFNEEMLRTIRVFFQKDLNLSDTARQLHIHRNTLVYRLDKLQQATGLDLRSFDDAVTFRLLLTLGGDNNDHPKWRL